MSSGNMRVPPKQSGYAAGLTARLSQIDGRGCFATTFFTRGQWLATYVGERVTREEGERRLQWQRKKRVSVVDEKWSIDGSVGGNGTEYINHSCNPNCDSLIYSGRINIYALRDILPGEEITVGYMDIRDFAFWECSCVSDYCRGKWHREWK
jgi:uncharacterized protein